MDTEDLQRRDAAVLWHPATPFDDHRRLPPQPIVAARGAWLETTSGAKILDGIGSWWTSLHGHGHPAIVEAVATQASRLDHVMFAGFTHEPAITLAERLVALAPGRAARVFFADCGAAAVEVAMKMSVQGHALEGNARRRRFAALRNGYHGETLGALSVCGAPDYRAPFADLLQDALFLPAPTYASHEHHDLARRCGHDAPELDEAISLLDRHADELAALVIEPIVQCAGRMTMIGSGYVDALTSAARARGVHVIADEIAVGFGRTGRTFASSWASVAPDFICLSKGLSGGVLPLAAVIVGEGRDTPFRGGPERAFLHSHTFTANPIACAAANASLGLLEATCGDPLNAAIDVLADARRRVAAKSEHVRAHRQAGTIVAFDLDVPEARRPADGRLSLAIREAAMRRGLLLRPLADTVYWMPPLTLDDATLEALVDRTHLAIADVLG
jgi:adenosylmethionine-8-amino-7-oxononanoate aminotransferase